MSIFAERESWRSVPCSRCGDPCEVGEALCPECLADDVRDAKLAASHEERGQ